MEDLQSEIHRYQFKDMSNLMQDIKADMEQNPKAKKLYTITLIRDNQLLELPNVNVTTSQELDDFYTEHYQDKQFSEVWFCKKNNTEQQLFSIGRVSFNTNQIIQNMDSQILEQLWNSNHRDIKKYNEKYEKAYIRATRKDWAMRYKIDKINMPKDNSLNQQQIMEQFTEAVKEIERKRENIELFMEYLKNIGIYEFSLEYLLQEGKMLFIDWDSNNDLKVINDFFKDEQER